MEAFRKISVANSEKLQGIFGDAQKKILRRMGKRVININKLADKYSEMSDEELEEILGEW